jgi:hypothetical protein
MSCDSPACSMERNGPTSLPLGLMTPMMAAAMRSSGRRVSRNATPPTTMSAAPTISMWRRPQRSACVVIHSEMPASPSSVSASKSPTAGPLMPMRTR